jgi:Site-specific recombinases, DNA invertase Pin homologs
MIYAYLRVSTKDKQEFDRQIFALKEYKIDQIFEEKISGTKAASSRPEFEKLLKVIQRGDTIYFESMSRMARSMQDLISTTNLLSQTMGVRVNFRKKRT